jgi:hypothetical protein
VFTIVMVAIVAGLLVALRTPLVQYYVYFQITLVLGLLAVVITVMVTVITQGYKVAAINKKLSYPVSVCPDYWQTVRGPKGDISCKSPTSAQTMDLKEVTRLSDADAASARLTTPANAAACS